MMAAFNVTALSDLGYDEKTSFIDPMEERYRAKPFTIADLSGRTGDFSDASIQAKMAFFNGLKAYKNVLPVESRLQAYWATHTGATTLVTSTTNGGSGGGSSTSTTSATTTSKVFTTKTSTTKTSSTKAATTVSIYSPFQSIYRQFADMAANQTV